MENYTRLPSVQSMSWRLIQQQIQLLSSQIEYFQPEVAQNTTNAVISRRWKDLRCTFSNGQDSSDRSTHTHIFVPFFANLYHSFVRGLVCYLLSCWGDSHRCPITAARFPEDKQWSSNYN
mmetsp:Transcript_48316/g.80018  ORF Transcript_48316/g.80018 Transcript_48316/m.80018 type:complete len:120 (+) Transcript_48316:350-709(+)